MAEYATTLEELTALKERNRVARDVHDILGHTTVSLIKLFEMSMIHFEKDLSLAYQDIIQAIQISKDSLQEIRSSVYKLASKNDVSSNIVELLNILVSNSRQLGVNIDFTVEGTIPASISSYTMTLYRICQEAITNSILHGKAENIIIILQFLTNNIRIFIFDDGCGCKALKKGMGLSGMEQRVKALKGNLIYGSSGEGGFNINVEIPL